MRRPGSLLTLLLGAALLAACRGPSALPSRLPLDPAEHEVLLVPDEADHAAADLAAAALAGSPGETARALGALERVEIWREAVGEPPTGLGPLAVDVANGVLFTGRDHRDATAELLERDDLEPALRKRLEMEQGDDPLILANARIYDARMRSFAMAFNTLAEPVGQSILTTSLVPYRLAQSVAAYTLQWLREDPLPLRRRQALAHWKSFLDRYPEAPEHDAIAERVADAEPRWHRTQANRLLDASRRALVRGRPGEALVHAERAAHHVPDARAEAARKKAARVLLSRDVARDLSIRFEPPPGSALVPEGAHTLAVALLLPDGEIERAAAAIDPEGPVADEALFARALARLEAGDEESAAHLLDRLAEDGGTVARHARTRLADPLLNPWDAFRDARSSDRRRLATLVLLGPRATRLPEITTVSLLEWALGLPGALQAVLLMPLRLVQAPFQPPLPTAVHTAVHAQRYLERHPHGNHAEEARDWLVGYERGRKNWMGALRLLEASQDADPKEVEALREKGARQALDVAIGEQRRDLRSALLHNVARAFPDTLAGREAGDLARAEVEAMTAHRITISRGFLLENPEIAGPEILGLDPAVLDGDAHNGELHPAGLTLVGGRGLEIALVGESGDEDEEPETFTVDLPQEQLERLVACLEETSFRNALEDEDESVVPDAQRDQWFERARLGLAEDVDTRATAEARYEYLGMRERYGMVRGRKSILPFDLVVQGSLRDLSLGAFPRMRMPERTPDSVLYE